jgi:dCMP deaminase
MQRPRKDEYYFAIAKQVASRSTCLDKQYGCVIVKDDRIVATGYNGSPSGQENCCDRGYCVKGDDKLKCVAVHAEANAIVAASPEQLKGATLYLNCINPSGVIFPCVNCMNLMINAKIARLMVPDRSEECDEHTIRRELNNKHWRICHSKDLDKNHDNVVRIPHKAFSTSGYVGD